MDQKYLHASELISDVRKKTNLMVIAAGYPEGHPEAENLLTDLQFLKTKVKCSFY